MNKTIAKSLVAIAFAGSMTFASCSSEEMMQGNAGETVKLIVSASKTDDGSRTQLVEQDGNLVCTWTAGDQLAVADESGVLGSLTLISGEGTHDGVFEGDVELGANTHLMLYYLGKDKAIPAVGTAKYTADLTTPAGTEASLASNDLLSAYTEVENINGTAHATVAMERRVAHAHFELVFTDGTVLKAGDEVKISALSENLYGNFSLNLKNLGTLTSKGDATYTVTMPEARNDFYVTIAPAKDLEPVFTVTTGGKTYTGKLDPRTWEQGQYVRKTNTDGTFSGVPVQMVAEQTVADHSKNPLLKWAKTNLDLSQADGFAVEQWDRGQLFQFGRNCGYTDYTDARSRYAVYCSEDSSEPWNIWGFNVYNGSGTGKKVDYSYSYSGETNSDPDEYFWVSDPDVNGSENDYWPERANLGDNWSTRAIADGWSTGDPSPAGWHIATTAEYAEIMPANELSGAQANVFGTGEIRSNSDCTYAIRWDIAKKTLSTNNVRYVLAVKCLVVLPDTKYADVDWNDENVIGRNFPAAGYIKDGYTKIEMWYDGPYTNAALANDNNYHTVDPHPNLGDGTYNYAGQTYYHQYLGVQRNAIPSPVGIISAYPHKVNSSSIAINTRVDADHSNFRTSYWTADGDCFGFCYDLSNTWPDAYFISMERTYKKTYAMPIRCVKD